MKPFTFRGVQLNSGNYRIQSTDAFSSPELEIKAVELARTDGSEAVFERYKERNMTFGGLIRGSSSDNLEANLDTLNILTSQWGNLDVGYNGGYRRRYVRLQNIIVTRASTDITQAGLSYAFYAPKPWATDGSTANIASTTITSGSNNISITASGSYPALPIYTLTLNSISVASGVLQLVISNQTESRYLTIERSAPVAGDVIVIDCVNTVVKYNGIAIRARGRFPVFAPGAGTLSISDNASSRSVTVNGPYDVRYI